MNKFLEGFSQEGIGLELCLLRHAGSSTCLGEAGCEEEEVAGK